MKQCSFFVCDIQGYADDYYTRTQIYTPKSATNEKTLSIQLGCVSTKTAHSLISTKLFYVMENKSGIGKILSKTVFSPMPDIEIIKLGK